MFQDTIDIRTKGGEGMFVLSLNRFEKGEERKRRLVQSEMIFRSSMDKLSGASLQSFFLFTISSLTRAFAHRTKEPFSLVLPALSVPLFAPGV